MANEETSENNSPQNEEQYTPHEERQASPISGCLIFSILFGCMTALVVICVIFYFTTKDKIHKASDITQTKTPQEKLIKSKRDAVRSKFTQFAEQVRKGEVSQLSLSVEEINLAISSYEKLKEFRGTLYLTGTETMQIDGKNVEVLSGMTSLAVRGGMFEENRYIHGTVKIKPTITDRAFFPQFLSLKTNNGEEIPEFLRQETNKGMVSSYKTDPDIADVFLKLTKAEIQNGQLVITSDPKADPPQEGNTESGLHNLLTGLSIFGILFFVIFSTFFFVHWVRKRNKKMKQLRDNTEVSDLEKEEAEHLAARNPDE